MYNDEGELVASWDELVNTYGLDITTSYAWDTYKTEEKSGYTVLNKVKEATGKTITKLVLPEVVTSLRDYAFAGCSDLTSVTFPSTFTTLGTSSFESCTGVTKLDFYDTQLATIGVTAFNRCTELRELYLPNTVETLGKQMIGYCHDMTIYYAGDNSAWDELKANSDWDYYYDLDGIGSGSLEVETDYTHS